MGIITDLTQAAVSIYGATRPPPTYTTQPVGFSNQALSTLPVMGVPGVDIIPDDPSCPTGARMLWDPKKGKWIKKRKRRRKRLATASDIKDLSALKSVLGGGKGLDTWIATH